MCQAICDMIKSKNFQDVKLAIGIINGQLIPPGNDLNKLHTLRCIQRFLIGFPNRSEEVNELESRILDALEED